MFELFRIGQVFFTTCSNLETPSILLILNIPGTTLINI